MTTNNPFVNGILANIIYWKAQTQEVAEPTQQKMATEYGNLYQAIEYGLRLPQTVVAAIELLVQSLAYIERHGQRRKWMPLYEQALTACPTEETYWRGQLLNHLGSAYRGVSDLEHSLDYHQQALEIAKTTGDDFLLGYTCLQLAEDHFRQANYVEAEVLGSKALKCFEGIEGRFSHERHLVWKLLGLTALYSNDWAKAEKHYQNALHLILNTNLVWEKVYILNLLVDVYSRQGQISKTESILAKMRQLTESTTDKLLDCHVLENHGNFYFRQERWKQAISYYLKIDTSFLQRTERKELLATTANNLGCAYWSLKKADEAKTHLQFAATLFTDLDNSVMLANVLHELGSIELYRNNFDKAESLFKQTSQKLSGDLGSFPANVIFEDLQSSLENLAERREQFR